MLFRSGDAASISLLGVQDVLIEKNSFDGSAPIKVVHTTGSPATLIVDNRFQATPKPVLTEAQAKVPPRVIITGNSYDGKPQ